ncbi:hypothetical protein [Chromobacterium sp. IIBBL 290-4]|uniref:hypothetical protein n=1 Tax=Chromobacterium sp. IIBBL 290-4 TaxID=2953890 RepID=UPI0020B6B0E7|nr:hypothetical protein [Chromobacterium sp. IIBBL 290-4]UTH73991.1 hypothetical protein NKT35_20980 [Chromobacterium sp. IIBBL 290-4]
MTRRINDIADVYAAAHNTVAAPKPPDLFTVGDVVKVKLLSGQLLCIALESVTRDIGRVLNFV